MPRSNRKDIDFSPQRILEVLHAHSVDHIVVGGLAGVLHGGAMSTEDLDIVPELTKTNLDNLADALNEMDARILSHEAEGGSFNVDFTGKELQKWIVDFRFLNLETKFGYLDLVHRPAATRGYADLAPSAVTADVQGIQIRIAALEDVIRSKQSVGRERDLEQLPSLRRLLEKQGEAGPE